MLRKSLLPFVVLCFFVAMMTLSAQDQQRGPADKSMVAARMNSNASTPGVPTGGSASDFSLHDSLRSKMLQPLLKGEQRVFAQHTIASGLWRTDGGFVAKIRMKNALVVAPLEVVPVLYMADGTEYRLQATTVPVAGVAVININEAMAHAPPSVLTHLSTFGSATLTYRYPSGGHLIATIGLQDNSRSLALVSPFTESTAMPEHPASTITTWEGVWWKHDADVQGFLALTNRTDQEAQADIRLISAGGSVAQAKTVKLARHSTQMYSLEETTDGLGAEGRAGGIRVEYRGEPNTIAVMGGLLNGKEGYSANIPFVRQIGSQTGTVSLGSAGLMVGKPDPMMRFPQETRFTPYLVLRNTTAKSIKLGLQLSYMTDTAPVSHELPEERLSPLATKRVNLPALLRSLGMKDFSGSINLSISHAGLLGEVIMATGSVDQTGTYVFEVEPQVFGSTHRKLGSYWDLDGGSNTMYSLWNPTDKPQDVLITLYYNAENGKYKIPVHLAPQASVMLDIKEIVEANAPDAAGKVFPANTTEGSAAFESADGPTGQINLVISGAVFNVVTGTCMGCCVPCCGTSDVFLTPPSDVCSVGDTTQFLATAEQCDGSSFLPGGNWSSNNTAVATVNSSGLMSAVSVGNATLAFTVNLPATTDCGYPSGNCTLTNFVGSVPVTVQVPDHLKVLTDTQQTINCGSRPSSIKRAITYLIKDQNDTQLLSAISMRENVPVTTSSCDGSITHTGDSCFLNTEALPNVIGQFTDFLVPGCPSSPAASGCGFSFLRQQWQWCPSSALPTSIGTIGPVRAQNTLINVDGNVLGLTPGTTFPK